MPHSGLGGLLGIGPRPGSALKTSRRILESILWLTGSQCCALRTGETFNLLGVSEDVLNKLQLFDGFLSWTYEDTVTKNKSTNKFLSILIFFNSCYIKLTL